jgi:uncharacterized protein with GYD domain
MSQFLVKLAYSPYKMNEISSEPVVARKGLVEKIFASMGGTTEVSYYAFGDFAVHCISGLPDHITEDTLISTLNSSGVVTCLSATLITTGDVNRGKNMVSQ